MRLRFTLRPRFIFAPLFWNYGPRKWFKWWAWNLTIESMCGSYRSVWMCQDLSHAMEQLFHFAEDNKLDDADDIATENGRDKR